MKQCNKCKENKSKKLFYKRKSCLDNIDAVCISCNLISACNRGHKNRNKARSYVEQIKRQHSCQHCFINDYRILCFHHLIPAKKKYTISRMVATGINTQKIQQEINK